MISRLSYDVLLNVLVYLDGIDAAALRATCRALAEAVDDGAWQQLYLREFGGAGGGAGAGGAGTTWIQKYAARYNSRVCTWGHNIDGRLGHKLSESTSRAENRRGSNRPQTLDLRKVRQISVGGYGVFMLRTNGSVCYYGWLEPRPRVVFNPNLKHFDGTYSCISAGRDSLWGLRDGRILNVATGQPVRPLDAFRFRLLSAGWAGNSAVDLKGRLLLWEGGDYDIPREVVPVIPEIEQIATGADYVLVLDAQQRLFWASTDAEGVAKAVQIYPELRPLRIRASFNRFAIVCENELHLGHWEDGERTLSSVQGQFVDAALGDYHTLALNAQGECFSWGRESQQCGSFGLGTQAEIVQRGGRAERSGLLMRDTVLETPQKLELRNVLHVAAGGWHSAAVCGGEDPLEALADTLEASQL